MKGERSARTVRNEGHLSTIEVSAGHTSCRTCGAPGDVYVAGRLLCARCALAGHVAELQRIDMRGGS